MKTKIQMLADAIALVENVDYEHYSRVEKGLKLSLARMPGNIRVTDSESGDEKLITHDERARELKDAQSDREPVLSALNYLKDALAVANRRGI